MAKIDVPIEVELNVSGDGEEKKVNGSIIATGQSVGKIALLVEAIQSVVKIIKSILDRILNIALKPLLDTFDVLLLLFGLLLRAFIMPLVPPLLALIYLLTPLVQLAWAVMMPIFKAEMEIVKQLKKMDKEQIKTGWMAVIGQTIATMFLGMFGAFIGSILPMILGGQKGGKIGIELPKIKIDLGEIIKNLFGEDAKKQVDEFINNIKTTAQNIADFSGILPDTKEAVNKLLTAIDWDQLKNNLSGLPDTIKNMKDVIDGFIDAIKSVVRTTVSVFNKAISFMNSGISKIKSALEDIGISVNLPHLNLITMPEWVKEKSNRQTAPQQSFSPAPTTPSLMSFFAYSASMSFGSILTPSYLFR